MADANERKLKLLSDFNMNTIGLERSLVNQLGYQKIDALTVIERKVVPLMVCASAADHGILRMDIYDFNNYTITTYSAHISSSSLDNISEKTRDFSAVEGKQSIRDAHRALSELGGTPPPIEEIMGYIMELQKDVSISTPLKLRAPKT